MTRLFGTDGVRGVANELLTPELVMRLGRAAAAGLSGSEGSRPRVIVARDTRISGEMLESALSAGLLSAGCDVVRCEVLPTPAVAFLVTSLSASAGAVVSASHNPVKDNGIKFFGPDGFKLSDAQEDEIEKLLDDDSTIARPIGDDVGRPTYLHDSEQMYVNHALTALEGRSLEGLKVVVDCANGAAYRSTPKALERAGATVTVLNASPTGTNINVGCGSTHPEVVAKAVIDSSADIGLAHDGDADRVIAVDQHGNVIDGDAMMAALAIDLKDQGRLAHDTVVTTVMANLGFRRAMKSAGIEVLETAVGDRYVIEEMRRVGASLGGEQSGHVIFSDFATTGDGLITALRLLGLLVSSGKTAADVASVVEPYPQVLVNVPVANRNGLDGSTKISSAIADAHERLGDDGRILIRPSGTEPLVRVMVEASTHEIARSIADEVAGVVASELGG